VDNPQTAIEAARLRLYAAASELADLVREVGTAANPRCRRAELARGAQHLGTTIEEERVRHFGETWRRCEHAKQDLEEAARALTEALACAGLLQLGAFAALHEAVIK
jgi:hypothetical protein